MISDNKYRVLEYQGLFSVQVNDTETYGWLWWKITKVNWVSCLITGEPFWFSSYPLMSPPSLERFHTLKEAMDQIKVFKTPSKHHYPK